MRRFRNHHSRKEKSKQIRDTRYSLPARAGEERLLDRSPSGGVDPNIVPLFDSPERNRDPDPVEAGPRNLRDVLLRNERVVVVLERLLQLAVRGQGLAQRPLVDCGRVRLEERGGDERLEDEEAAEVDAVDAVRAPRPARVERRRPRVRPR